MLRREGLCDMMVQEQESKENSMALHPFPSTLNPDAWFLVHRYSDIPTGMNCIEVDADGISEFWNRKGFSYPLKSQMRDTDNDYYTTEPIPYPPVSRNVHIPEEVGTVLQVKVDGDDEWITVMVFDDQLVYDGYGIIDYNEIVETRDVTITAKKEN